MATDSFGGTLIEDSKLDQFGGTIINDKPEKPASSWRRVADVGISAVKGVIGVPESIVGLADIVTGGRAGKLAEEAGFRPKEAKAILDEYLSPQQQAANKALADTKGFFPTVGTALQNPSTILHSAIESLPLMGAGGVAARGLVKAAGTSPWVAGAVGEGLASAGQNAEQVRQETPGGLLSPGQAATQVASGFGTGALALAGAGLARKLKIRDIDTWIAEGKLAAPAGASGKGFARRLAEGAVSEGVFEELPQSLQEQMWQNYALDKPIMEGVPEAGAMGMLTGAVMGGPAAALGGNAQPVNTPPELNPRDKLLNDTAEAVIRKSRAEQAMEADAKRAQQETKNDRQKPGTAAGKKTAKAAEETDAAGQAVLTGGIDEAALSSQPPVIDKPAPAIVKPTQAISGELAVNPPIIPDETPTPVQESSAFANREQPEITMAEVEKVRDIPTVEMMREAIAAVGEDEFQRQAQAKIEKYKPTSPDQEAMLVEATATEIVVKNRRKPVAIPGKSSAVSENGPEGRSDNVGGAVLQAVAEARAIQAKFLSDKGLTIDQARAMSKPDQAALQNEYSKWLQVRQNAPGEALPAPATTIPTQPVAPQEAAKAQPPAPAAPPPLETKTPPDLLQKSGVIPDTAQKSGPDSSGATITSREPWEMTRAEWGAFAWPKTEDTGATYTPSQIKLLLPKDYRRYQGKSFAGALPGSLLHRKAAVAEALKQGKPVPASVLADYPDLQQNVGTSPQVSANLPESGTIAPKTVIPKVGPIAPETGVRPAGKILGADVRKIADVNLARFAKSKTVRIADLAKAELAWRAGNVSRETPAKPAPLVSDPAKQPHMMTKAAFVDAAKSSFVREKGKHNIDGVQWNNSLYMLKDGEQRNGKLTKSPEEILGRIHREQVEQYAKQQRSDVVDAEQAPYLGLRDMAKLRIEASQYPSAEVLADYPDLAKPAAPVAEAAKPEAVAPTEKANIGDRIRFTPADTKRNMVVEGEVIQIDKGQGDAVRYTVRTGEQAPQGGGPLDRQVWSNNGTVEVTKAKAAPDLEAALQLGIKDASEHGNVNLEKPDYVALLNAYHQVFRAVLGRDHNIPSSGVAQYFGHIAGFQGPLTVENLRKNFDRYLEGNVASIKKRDAKVSDRYYGTGVPYERMADDYEKAAKALRRENEETIEGAEALNPESPITKQYVAAVEAKASEWETKAAELRLQHKQATEQAEADAKTAEESRIQPFDPEVRPLQKKVLGLTKTSASWMMARRGDQDWYTNGHMAVDVPPLKDMSEAYGTRHKTERADRPDIDRLTGKLKGKTIEAVPIAEYMQEVSNGSPISVVMFDADGRVAGINRAYYDVLKRAHPDGKFVVRPGYTDGVIEFVRGKNEMVGLVMPIRTTIERDVDEIKALVAKKQAAPEPTPEPPVSAPAEKPKTAADHLEAAAKLMREAAAQPNPEARPEPAPRQDSGGPDVEQVKNVDVGENLWYNRRNFTGKALAWDDIKNLNDTLKVKEVIKSKVWPRPDYEQLVTDGMQPIFARLLKQVYDGIATTPAGKADADLQRYIATVSKVRDAVFDWAKDNNANREFMDAVAAEIRRRTQRGPVSITSMIGTEKEYRNAVLDRVWPNQGSAQQRFARGSDNLEEARAIGGSRALKHLQFTMDDMVDAMKDLEKGWPKSQEAWQRQGMRVLAPNTYTLAGSPTTRYVDGKSVETGGMYWRIEPKDGRGTSFVKNDAVAPDIVPERHYVLIGKRSAVQTGFDTEQAAIEAARESTKREVKGGEIRGMNIAKSERTGPDRRATDENVTSDRLMTEFGFRGVNFGREGWINQNERQAYLNAAYDGLLDLAEVLDIPPKALSLNGMLGIAFGAQGRGGHAAAHFVPGVNEINLTKTMGAGTLAHEWGHALDHYFATMGGMAKAADPFVSEHAARIGPDGYIKDAGKKVPAFPGVRPEISAAFKTVVEAMNRRAMTPEEIAKREADYRQRTISNLDSWIKSARKDIEAFSKERDAALTEFDQLATRLRAGDVGDGYIKVGQMSLPQVVGQIRLLVRDKNKGGSWDIPSNWKGLAGVASSVRYMLAKSDATVTHVPQETTSTAYQRESFSKDKEKGGKRYWATEHEMFARAFETYVADQLAEREQKNTFLSDAAIRAEMKDREGKGYLMPYPRGDERKTINEAFGKLVGEIETRETDKGVEMYSQTGEPGPGLPAADIRAHIAGITEKLSVAVPVYDSVEQARLAGFKIADDAQGFAKGDRLGLISGRINTLLQAEKTLFHELWHVGIKRVTSDPDTVKAFANYNAALNRVAMANPGVRKRAAEWRAQYGKDKRQQFEDHKREQLTEAKVTGKVQDDIIKAAGPEFDMRVRLHSFDEAIAEMAGERRGKPVTRLNELIAALQRLVRALGFDGLASWMESKTDAEVLSLIRSATQAVGKDTVAFGGELAGEPSYAHENSGIMPGQLQTNEDNREITDRLQAILQAEGQSFTITPVSLPVAGDGTLSARGEREGRQDRLQLDEGASGVFGQNGDPDIMHARAGGVGEAVATPFHEENERLRERDKTAWDKAKKYLKRQFSPGGLLPQSVFDEKVTRDSQMNAVEFDIRHQVGMLEMAVMGDYGKKFIELPKPVSGAISSALSGAVSETIKPKTREAIYAMRQYIDRMSERYSQILDAEVDRELAKTGLSVADSRGALNAYLGALEGGTEDIANDAAAKYLELSLADQKEAGSIIRKLSASGVMTNAARAQIIRNNIGEYVHRSYQAFDDRKWFQKLDDATINAAREYLTERYFTSGLDETEAERKAEVTLHEIVKSGTAYDSMGAFIREGKLGAKDLSILMRRKVIAPEIRALLGEYKDARLNYAKSATKMGRLIWNQTFLDAVRERGMGVFLFEGDNRPPDATKQLSGEASESYAPLNGLWTFPDVDQAFRDALGKEHMDKWYETIVQLNGMVKFGKTILSPTTAARNWQSAFLFTVANGHFDLSHIAKSISGLREYFTQQGAGAKLAYLRELQELGVVYDNPYAGEMMRLLADSKLEDTLLRGKDPMKVRDALAYAQKFYQFGDDFWKIVGFENEKALLIKHAGMTEAQAKKEAAQRVRNTYPTYSMVGRAMHFLRRFPLAGTFVSFPSEIIRTVGNMIRYAAQDWKTPGMRPLATRRIAGLSIAAASAHAMAAMSMALLGLDDDDEEAVRDLSPTWSKNSNFLFLGRDDKGRLQYVDLSYVDPYNYFKRPLTAILRDQPWEKIAADVFRETLAPFLGTDIAAGAIFEVLANKKESGGRVYLERDEPWRQTAAIADHLRKTLQPGVASNLERTYKAIAGEVSISGKKYDPMEEAAGWAGWRVSTLDAKVALYYRTFEFKDSLRDASSAFNRVARNPNDVSSSEIRSAVEHTRTLRADAFREMARIVKAAKSGGLTTQEIVATLRGNQVSMRDITALLRGTVSPWQPTPASLRGAVQRANTLLGPGKSGEFVKRYREAREVR